MTAARQHHGVAANERPGIGFGQDVEFLHRPVIFNIIPS
jgi:hypothetical protein